MQSCRPTDGPGSGCAIGTAYSERLNCCVATPGQDGSSCVGDPQTGDAPTTPVLRSLAPPSQTGYDYGTGYCDPNGGNNGCPQGYAYNESTGTCQPSTQGPQPLNDDGSCSEGYIYDEAYGLCFPTGQTVAGCGEGQYFDYELGYCVQANCGGCALGYYFNYDLQVCVPEGGQGTTTEQGCWVSTQTVPTCAYATPTPGTKDCRRGEEYNPNTNRCESADDHLGCADYNNANACNNAPVGCDWVCTSSSYSCNFLGPSFRTYECQDSN
jgi:hypothetical protein